MANRLGDLRMIGRFERRNSSRARWCGDSWITWNGTKWQADNDNRVLRLAFEEVDLMQAEADGLPDGDGKDRLIKLVRTYSRVSALEGMLRGARPLMAIKPQELDANPFLLNAKNGTINLKTGRLQPHDPKDFITKCTNIDYLPTARCEEWGRFLRSTHGNDKSVIAYLRQVAGYCATGAVNEEKLFFIHGPGRNGKSTFCQTLLQAMGEYAWTADPSALFSRGDRQSQTLVDMSGKRLILAIDTDENRALDEVSIKRLCSNDQQTGRQIYGRFQNITPSWHVVLTSNHEPRIRSTDHGTIRRLQLIPFNRTFDGPADKKDLREKLAGEIAGIFGWVVDAAIDYIQEKQHLKPPKVIEEATQAFVKEQDIFGVFLTEWCDTDPKAQVRFVDVLKAFKYWCRISGYPYEERYWGNKHVGTRLQKHFNKKLMRVGKDIRLSYFGVCIKPHVAQKLMGMPVKPPASWFGW